MKPLLSQLTCLLITGLLVTGCSNEKKSLLDDIRTAEKALYKDTAEFSLSINQSYETIRLYEKFAEAHPEDSLAPEYLFKAVELSKYIGKFEKAIGHLETLLDDYPDFRKAPYCLFLQGFIYENELEALDKAEAIYQQFLEEYPNHELAKDVKYSIKHLGKSPDELIKEFEAQEAAEDSAEIVG